MVKRIKMSDNSGGNYFSSPKDELEFIQTGSLLLDLALGGGWIEGRIINIVGDKSTGKSLLCIEACANFVRKYRDKKCKIYYRETEAAFDKSYARALGMPVDRVDFGDPFESVEDLFEDLQDVLAKSKGHPSLYIVDSLDALSDRGELSRDMDAGSFGVEKAKKMSRLFRQLTQKMSNSNLTLIVISQVRSKIGVSFGRTTTRSGGRGLDFYASQVVFLAHKGTTYKTKSGVKRATAVHIKALVDKNKVSLPFRDAEFEILFGYGINDVLSCLEWLSSTGKLSELGVSQKSIKAKATKLIEASDKEALAEIAEIQKHVRRAWQDVEAQFMPARCKYGDIE